MPHIPPPLCKHYNTNPNPYGHVCRCLDTVVFPFTSIYHTNLKHPCNIICPFKTDDKASLLCKYYEKSNDDRTQLTELICKMKDVLNDAQLALYKLEE